MAHMHLERWFVGFEAVVEQLGDGANSNGGVKGGGDSVIFLV